MPSVSQTAGSNEESRAGVQATSGVPQESLGIVSSTRLSSQASTQPLSPSYIHNQASRLAIAMALETNQNSRQRIYKDSLLKQESRSPVLQAFDQNEESYNHLVTSISLMPTEVRGRVAIGRATPEMSIGKAGPLITQPKMRYGVRSDKPNLSYQVLKIYNDGWGTLNWTATTDQSWLTVSPTSGSIAEGGSPATLHVFTDHTGLSAGEHVGHVSITGSGTVVSTVTLAVFAPQVPAYKVSRYPAMAAVNYPLVPPRPAKPIVDVTVFTAPTFRFVLPPDTRDLFGILIQDKRTLINSTVTLASDGADDRFMLVSGQDELGNYMEERIQLNGTTPVTTTKTFHWILWVNSTYGTVLNEVPTPVTDGATTTFTVAKNIVPQTLTIYLNGLALVESTADVPADFTVAGNSFTLTVAPATGYLLQTSYIYEVVTNRNVSINGGLGTLAAGALQWLANPIIYRYEDLSFGGSPDDPALTYTFDNSEFLPELQLYAYFYNILDELSRPLDYLVELDDLVNCLDVRRFGAKCDGITNDTAAVQLAIDTANANYLHDTFLGSPPVLGSPPLGSPITFGPTVVCIHSGCNCLVGGVMPAASQNGKDISGYALNMKSGVGIILDGQLTLVPPLNDTYAQGLFVTYQEGDLDIRGEGVMDASGSLMSRPNVDGFISFEGYDLAIGGTLTLKSTGGVAGDEPAIRMILHDENKKSDISHMKILGPGFGGGIFVGAHVTIDPSGNADQNSTAEGLMIDSMVLHDLLGGPGIVGTCSAWTIQNCDILNADVGIAIQGGKRITIANNKVVQNNAVGSPFATVAGSGGPGIILDILTAESTPYAPGCIVGCRVYANHVEGMIGGTDPIAGTGIALFVPSIAGDTHGQYMAAVEIASNVSNNNDAYGIRLVDAGAFGGPYQQINMHNNSAAHNGIEDYPDPLVPGDTKGISSVSVDVTGNKMLVRGAPYQFFLWATQHWTLDGTIYDDYAPGYAGPFPLLHAPVPDSLVVRLTTVHPVVQAGPTLVTPASPGPPATPDMYRGADPTPMAVTAFRDDWTIVGTDLYFTNGVTGDLWITYRYLG